MSDLSKDSENSWANDEWWHRREQAPIQLETISPVATHGLLALEFLYVRSYSPS